MSRDEKNVYKPVLDGKAQYVVGLDIMYGPPDSADLILPSDTDSPDELLETLWQDIRNRIYDNKLTNPDLN